MVGLLEEMVSAVPSDSPIEIMQEHIKEARDNSVSFPLVSLSNLRAFIGTLRAPPLPAVSIHLYFVCSQMAEQVVGVRPRLHKVAECATDEAVLMATLALGEQLEAVLLKHDELVAAAASGSGAAAAAASASASGTLQHCLGH